MIIISSKFACDNVFCLDLTKFPSNCVVTVINGRCWNQTICNFSLYTVCGNSVVALVIVVLCVDHVSIQGQHIW